MSTVEAVLTKIVLALLALQHGRTVFALLAHDHRAGLPNHIHLILLLSDLPKEFDGILQVLHDATEIQLLLHVGLDRLLHHTEEEELLE